MEECCSCRASPHRRQDAQALAPPARSAHCTPCSLVPTFLGSHKQPMDSTSSHTSQTNHPLRLMLTVGRVLLAELVGPLLLDGGVLGPRPTVHVLLRQAQQACDAQGVAECVCVCVGGGWWWWVGVWVGGWGVMSGCIDHKLAALTPMSC